MATRGAGIRTTPGLLSQLPLQPVPEGTDSCSAGTFPCIHVDFPEPSGRRPLLRRPPWKKPEKTLSHVRSPAHLGVCRAQGARLSPRHGARPRRHMAALAWCRVGSQCIRGRAGPRHLLGRVSDENAKADP